MNCTCTPNQGILLFAHCHDHHEEKMNHTGFHMTAVRPTVRVLEWKESLETACVVGDLESFLAVVANCGDCVENWAIILACRHNRLNFLQAMQVSRNPRDYNTMIAIIDGGNVDIAAWMFSLPCSNSYASQPQTWLQFFFAEAVKAENLPLASWARAKCAETSLRIDARIDRQPDSSCFQSLRNAYTTGNIAVIEYVEQVLLEKTFFTDRGTEERIFALSWKGHVHVLDWMEAKWRGTYWRPKMSHELFRDVAMSCNPAVIAWFLKRFPESMMASMSRLSDCGDFFAEGARSPLWLETFKWFWETFPLLRRRSGSSSWLEVFTRKKSALNVFQWVVSQVHPDMLWLSERAWFHRNLPVAEWAYCNGGEDYAPAPDAVSKWMLEACQDGDESALVWLDTFDAHCNIAAVLKRRFLACCAGWHVSCANHVATRARVKGYDFSLQSWANDALLAVFGHVSRPDDIGRGLYFTAPGRPVAMIFWLASELDADSGLAADCLFKIFQSRRCIGDLDISKDGCVWIEKAFAAKGLSLHPSLNHAVCSVRWSGRSTWVRAVLLFSREMY